MAEGRPLLRNWVDSRLVRPVQNKLSGPFCDAPYTYTTTKTARSQPSLEGQGKRLSLSPVFPVRPPTSDHENHIMEVDGNGLWPIGKFDAFLVVSIEYQDRTAYYWPTCCLPPSYTIGLRL